MTVFAMSVTKIGPYGQTVVSYILVKKLERTCFLPAVPVRKILQAVEVRSFLLINY